MMRMSLVAVLAIGLLAMPDARAKPLAEDENNLADSAEKIIGILHGSRMAYEKDPSTTPLMECLDDQSRRYKVRFVVNNKAFRNAGEPGIGAAKAMDWLATNQEQISLHRFLTMFTSTLGTVEATYLVREDHIEITTREAAREECFANGGAKTSKLPLVCVVVKEKPLPQVLNDLARIYGFNVIFDESSRDPGKIPVITERLLNVPADVALELLAGKAELKVVRKGNTFRITK